jgi:AbrB family looped-hinge helix DNA binding protein
MLQQVRAMRRRSLSMRALGSKQVTASCLIEGAVSCVFIDSVVGSKGRVTIPAELRKLLGIKGGAPATRIEEKGRLILVPMTKRRIEEVQGFLKPKQGAPSMFGELFAERERERKRGK